MRFVPRHPWRRAAGGLALLAALGPLAACSSVGAALVDQVHGDDAGIPVAACNPPPPCEQPMMPTSVARRPALPVNLARCGTRPIRTCAIAPTPDATDSGDADAGADADFATAPAECATSFAPAELAALDDGTLECQDLRIVDPEDELVITGLTLRHTNLSIRSSKPVSVRLDDATFADVFVSLEGAVTLAVTHSRSATDLRVVGAATPEARPRLQLSRVDATALLTGTQQTAFAGTISVDQLTLTDSQLVADQVELTSVTLIGGRIDAASLNATDTQISEAVLALGDGVLSASIVRRSSFERCHALSVIGSELHDDQVARCDGPPTRLYSALVTGGNLDGRIESDRATLDNLLFGLNEPTEVLAFSGKLDGVNFCAHAQHAVLGYEVLVRCAQCELGLTEPDPVCTVPASPPSVKKANFCELLQRPDALPRCEEPVPERPRPLEQAF